MLSFTKVVQILEKTNMEFTEYKENLFSGKSPPE